MYFHRLCTLPESALVRKVFVRCNQPHGQSSTWLRHVMQIATSCNLYATIKAHFGRDHSLYHNNALERRVWLWFRSGSSPLAIETLRGKCEREKRLCPLCSEEVESEDHFFCRCPQLADVRGNWKSDLIGELRGAANDREAAAAIEQSNHFTFTQYALGMAFGATWRRADQICRSMAMTKTLNLWKKRQQLLNDSPLLARSNS